MNKSGLVVIALAISYFRIGFRSSPYALLQQDAGNFGRGGAAASILIFGGALRRR